MTSAELARMIETAADQYNGAPFTDSPVGIPLLMGADRAKLVLDALIEHRGFVPVAHLQVRKDRVDVACYLGALLTPTLLQNRTHLMAVWEVARSKVGKYTETREVLKCTLKAASLNAFDAPIIEV
jgi:hypothetical protein